MDSVGEINGYLERTAPWREAKAGHSERVAAILYIAAEALRGISVLLARPATIRLGWPDGRAVAAAGVAAARAAWGRAVLGWAKAGGVRGPGSAPLPAGCEPGGIAAAAVLHLVHHGSTMHAHAASRAARECYSSQTKERLFTLVDLAARRRTDD